MSASPLRVRPRDKSELAEPRTIERYRREVVALLRVGRGIPRSRGTLLVKRWDKYVRARWLQGKPPCNVADHIGKFEREKLVKPARDKTNKRMTRTAFARQMRPVATRRSSRASRDADNPRMGEIYETRGGSRWQVVSTSDKLITVKRAGHRTEGPYAWGKESLKGMKQVPRPLFGVGGLFGIGGAKPANETEARDPERRRSRHRRVHKGLWGLAKRAHKRVKDFSPRALAKGTRVEMEHTEQRSVARRIAMDHLTEDPRYYDKLARMESRRGNSRDWGQKEPRWAWTIFNRRHGYLSELHPDHKDPRFRVSWDSSKSSAWLFASERTAAQVIARHPILRGAYPQQITVSEGHNGKSFDPKLRTGSHLRRDPSRKRKRGTAKRTARKTTTPRKRGRTPKSEGAHCSGAPILARKARKVEPPHTCPSATHIQSYVFERWCWTLDRARSWVKRHGGKTEVDTSERYYRFRQLSPKTYKPVGTVPFMRGLNAIMGCTRIAKKRKKT